MARARTELIHCDNCGEDYAATYRRCPFCDAKPGQRFQDPEPADDYEEPFDDDELTGPLLNRGGKRLEGSAQPAARRRSNAGRGVGFWVRVGLYVVSAAVIIAAIWIVSTYLFPRLFRSGVQESDPAQEASPSPAVVETATPAPVQTPDPIVDDDPLSLDSPDLPAVEPDPIFSTQPVATPEPVSTTAPVSTQSPVTPAPGAALKLSSSDFTLSPKYPTYQIEISGVGRAQATYAIANEKIATVSSTGLVTGVSNGSTKLTVTDKDGNSATCIVRVSGMTGQSTASAPPASSEAPASATPAPSASSGAKLNHSDFTINAQYPDPVRLKVIGGEASGWASSNGGVASVSENGTVTAVGNGSAKITCTLTDGTKLTAVVYVSGK